ncbi:MAG: hypothetical protein MI741_07570, partial [Rhodospirillales bacterium]|nr:hypothetical protein [Rhodospirillales bacterium]
DVSTALSEGGTLKFTVTYTRLTGTLNVNLTDAGSGATYKIEGPDDFNSGSALTGQTNNFSQAVPTGSYSVTFDSVTGYDLGVTTLASAGTKFTEVNPSTGTVGDSETHTVNGTYTLKQYTVKVNSTTGGSTDKDGDNTVNHGESLTITPTADSGYTFTGWTGGNTSSDNPLTLNNITSDTDLTPEFTRDTGRLKVVLNDAGSGATFKIEGPSDFNVGNPLTGQTSNYDQDVPTGDYTVTFSNETGYDVAVSANPFAVTDNSASGTLDKNQTETVTGDYSLIMYIVQVNSATGGSTDKDGGNNVDHGTDITITATPDTGYSFVQWTGDNTSSDNPLTLSDVTGDFDITPEFSRDTARLVVNLDQAGSGGSFSISGPSDYTPVNNRTTNYDENVPTGDYTVTFSTVANFDISIAASSFTVGSSSASGTLAKDDTETVEGTYADQLGSLTVNIEPPEAADGGAQWQVDGSSPAPSGVRPAATLYNSGQTVILPVGDYTVSFSTISGWDTPPSQGVTVTSGGVTVLNLSGANAYQQHTGSLRVSIVSSDAVTAGAAWSLNNSSSWRDAGTVAGGIPIGSHTVKFRTVSGWITPDEIPVTIFRDQTSSVTGIYAEEGKSGSLQVFISDNNNNDVAENGAQWRPIFPGSAPASDVWYDSGDIISSVPEGTIGIEFSVVAGYLLPSLTSVEITEGKNKFTGEYLRPLIIHKSDYNGDGTEDLA